MEELRPKLTEIYSALKIGGDHSLAKHLSVERNPQNYAGVSNPEIDAWFDEQRQETDKDKRRDNQAVVAYVEARLAASDAYRGLGEFHLAAADVGSPEMARLIALARERGLFLHAHTDAAGIEALVAAAHGVRVLWAHAGLGEPVTTVDAVLTRHPGLMADLSYRYGNILTRETLDPAWREVLVRHADRFLMASDTWAPSRWPALPAITTQARTILAGLPADVAARLAHGNLEALLAP